MIIGCCRQCKLPANCTDIDIFKHGEIEHNMNIDRIQNATESQSSLRVVSLVYGLLFLFESRWPRNFPRCLGDAADESWLSNWDNSIWTPHRMQRRSRHSGIRRL